MRIHIGSCCWASAQSGFEACRCNMRTKGNMYIIFQEIKPNANVKHYNETHNLDENDSVSMIAHHVLYLQTMTCQIDKDLSSSQMGAMKPPMQIFEPLCESKEVVQNMFPKNEGVFAALASQPVASPESRQKKTFEHPGWLETHHTSLV